MSVPFQPATASQFNPASVASEIGEGDWGAYERHAKFCGKTDVVASKENLNAFRRLCALAYLGKNAQLYGAACSRTVQKTFSHRFMAELGASNESRRFMRYPWLGKLMGLVAEIEREQANLAGSGNIISLVNTTK